MKENFDDENFDNNLNIKNVANKNNIFSKNLSFGSYNNNNEKNTIQNELTTSKIIKENRLIMNNIIKKLKEMMNIGTNNEELINFTSEFLLKSTIDIKNLLDEENNSLAHILTKEQNIKILKIIIQTYYLLLNYNYNNINNNFDTSNNDDIFLNKDNNLNNSNNIIFNNKIYDNNNNNNNNLNNNKEIFYKWLMQKNSENLTALDIACSINNKQIIQLLFNYLSTSSSIFKEYFSIPQNFVFHYSAKNNHIYPILFFYEKLQKIFPEKKIFDIPNEYKITPLHYACYNKSLDVIDVLLILGADVNAVDNEGKSVLFYAVKCNNSSLIKKLLMNGANKYIKDFKGKTPFDEAKKNKFYGVMNVLKEKSFFKRFFYCYFGIDNFIVYEKLEGKRFNFNLMFYLIVYGLFYFFLIDFNDENIIDNKIKIKIYYNKNIFILILFILNIFSFFTILFFVFFFVFCQKNINENNNKFNNQILINNLNKNKYNKLLSIVDLFEKDSKVCIKCKRFKKESTIHCVICDICVDNYDHHCYFLNTCINNSNKKLFKIFLYILIFFFLINFIFGFFQTSNIKKEKDFNKNEKKFLYVFWVFYIIIFFIIFIYFLYPFFLKNNSNKCCCCYKSRTNETISEYESNLLISSENQRPSETFD